MRAGRAVQAGPFAPGGHVAVLGRNKYLTLLACVGVALGSRGAAAQRGEQTEGSIIYALGHMLREKITIRSGRVLDSRRGFDPATPRSEELAISPYDSGDDSCRSADDQRTILRPVPCSRFPQ